jgi:hypothetical protein
VSSRILHGSPEDSSAEGSLTIQAYIDDSGVKGTDPVFVLAGFIGKAEKWASFSDDWKRHLDESPSVKYLKMNEAAKLDGEFRFWTKVKRDQKLRGCIEVIKRFLPDAGIYLLNDLVAWQQIITNPVKTLADPHFMAFQAIIGAICNEVLDSGANEPVEIIFDEHFIFGPRIAHWYPVTKEMIQTSKDKRINAISHLLPSHPMFRNDKEFAPLQAADILAWLLRNAFMDRLPGLQTAIQVLLFVGLAAYTYFTYGVMITARDQVRVSQKQATLMLDQMEASQRPCLTLSMSKRKSHEIALGRLAGVQGSQVLHMPDDKLHLINIGNGPALNVDFDVIEAGQKASLDRDGHLLHVLPAEEFPLYVSNGIPLGGEWCFVATFESRTGQRYKTQISVFDRVPKSFKFDPID